MGKNWAIAIGINQYNNLQHLKYAKLDAEAMGDWFTQEARFDQVFLFTDDSPPIPTNPPILTQPTFGHVWRFLRAQFEVKNALLKPEDNLWFFFAGHGNRYKDKDYLMFSDSDPGDIERTAISVDDVTQRLQRSGAGNVVLFLDACRDESSRSGLGFGEQRHQGVITFYSCIANQKSWEIDELQHGSFSHSLLAALQLQGEANCATVERLAQNLSYQVPRLNTRYGKKTQNPYWQADPPYKMYFILLEQTATLRDVEPLKYQASQAENRGDLLLAKQLWVRVLAVSRSDDDAIDAIERIARKRGNFEPSIKTVESVTLSSGGRSVSAEMSAQRQEEERIKQQQDAENRRQQQQEEHRQNLSRYQQAFSQAVEQEFPLSKASCRQLRNLQKSLQLTDKEVSLEQLIIAPKEAEYRQQQEQERIRQQREKERLRQQQEAEKCRKREAQRQKQQQQLEKWRQLFTTITTPTPINRRRFLQWVGWGSGSLAIAVVGREILKSPTPISVAEPKYIPPIEGASKVLELPLWTVEFETVTVDDKGQVTQRDSNKQAKFFKEDLGNDITLEMVSIPGGSFQMGSPPGEKGRSSSESPQHDVNVPAFFMGKYPVTQAQWRRVAALPKVNRDLEVDPSRFKGDGLPVDQVSWHDAVEFCSRLSKHTNKEYRLASEAEWEYACRAGTTTPFHFGETITTELAHYNGSYTYASEPKGEYRQKTTEVGSFPPNGFGLYDMHGNVWEWCLDDWHGSYEGAPTDGSAGFDNNDNLYQKQGTAVVRGGSWLDFTEGCRSASRFRFNGAGRATFHEFIGFRVVCAAGRILR
ncbi:MULTISPECIES: SUMF1/EgtB/PvdO family nonheme iron enzyme [unclassified Anabaena]|uniref:SUMF1/EgtB/PvdO family nonheme iron enzyme n=1 Tax=unclassified Anabaena TaxID=2619674 RepID=UPI0039C6D720